MVRLNVGLFTLRHVAVCNLLDELGVWVEEHDVEVLHGMNRLQSGPVLEPHDLVRVSIRV